MLKGQNKRDVVSRVTNSALHILTQSYLPDSRLWPTAGIRMGNGLSMYNKECIFLGVVSYGVGEQLNKGRLALWPTTKNEQRERSQKKHIKLILDQALYDNVLFTDEFEGSLDYYLWFKYEIEK